jgi:hypothetical protein
MRGGKPVEYKLKAGDRRYLQAITKEGSQLQGVARRAHLLLALDRGERIVEILRWLNVSRMGVGHVGQRSQQRGVTAMVDEERSGRPLVFSPVGARARRADGVSRSRRVRSAPDTLGLPESAAVCECAGRGGHAALHDRGAQSGRGQLTAPSEPLVEDGHY